MTIHNFLTISTIMVMMVNMSPTDTEFRTPTLYDISKMNDPLLNEVFYESNIELRHRTALPGEPPLLSTTNVPPAPRNPNYNGEVPINRPSPLGQPQQQFTHPPNTQIGAPDGLTELAAASGKLAFGGAQVFAKGAEQVGRAFGFQPMPQNDFFNQAAQFFG